MVTPARGDFAGVPLTPAARKLGLAWDPAMLAWPAGPHPQDGVWARHWYANTWSSTGFTTDLTPEGEPSRPDVPFYDEALLQRGIGVRFKGEEKTNVDEYCVSEGWVHLAAGKAVDRKGNQLTIKLQGTVEPYFQDSETADPT